MDTLTKQAEPDSFEKEKQEIAVSMARTIYTQLDKGTIEFAEAQEIARFILEHFDKASSREELLPLLNDMSAKWSVFESLKGLLQMKVTDAAATQQKIEEVKQDISQLGG